mmetsp:Transcript_7195/g.13239  ORF Transcript_7195/g.13239 Transcript_7195/m.13239 type:complete len:258 (-) Transcript_7195:168-941(-)
MKIIFLFSLATSTASAFLVAPQVPMTTQRTIAFTCTCRFMREDSHTVDGTRADLLNTLALVAGASVLSSFSSPAQARGRATLVESYDRYTPRIIAGGQFYTSDLKRMVEKADWSAIKAATADPPKKTKEDRSKRDGGVSDRAKLAGQFSNARVTTACDLFAAAFSDNSISPKTKKMQAQADKIRSVIDEMSLTARQGLGEESGGGFFGFGAKKPSQAELAKRVRQLYVEGGNAYNEYIFAANEEPLPLNVEKLPYLK